jgi:protein phosphatase
MDDRGAMKWKPAGKSDVGRVRPGNEDAYFIDGDYGVFLVADGMGGHAAGEIASRMAAEMVGPGVSRAVAQGLRGSELERRIAELVVEANRAILERAEGEPEKRGMGTTLTVLALGSNGYRLGQVGDSRGYLLRDDELTQITRDHTVVQQQVERGALTSEQARLHPLSHVLTRALGTDEDIEADTYHGKVKPGDVYLLCSDGLSGMVGDGQLEEILTANGTKPEQAVDELIRAANEAGGQDNITAVVVRVED